MGSVIDGITGVLGSDRVANSIGKLGTSIGGLLKLSDSFISVIGSIGPFLGFLGPMLNFLSLFLGDPVEKKLDLIIEKIETLQEAMLRGFNRIENLIKAQDCRRSLKPAVDDITLAMGNLEEILKNSRNDPNGGTAQERREEYFIRLSTLGAKKENVERALSAIQSAFLGGSLAPCNIIDLISDGTDFTNGIKGSSDSLFRISTLLLSKMEEGIAFLVAFEEAIDRDVQRRRSPNNVWVENKQRRIDRRINYLRRFNLFLEGSTPTQGRPLSNIPCSSRNTNAIPCLIDSALKRLENPNNFAQNMRQNLKKLWEDLETSKSVQDNAWSRDESIHSISSGALLPRERARRFYLRGWYHRG